MGNNRLLLSTGPLLVVIGSILTVLVLVITGVQIAALVHQLNNNNNNNVGDASVSNRLTSAETLLLSDTTSNLTCTYRTPVSGNGIAPCHYEKPPSTLRCSSFGLIGLRLDGSAVKSSGRHSFANSEVPDPNNYVDLVVSANRASCDFHSTLPISGVLVKSGTSVNYYSYAEKRLSDTGLGGSAQSKDISYVEFCYNLNLEVTKTVDASCIKERTWYPVKGGDNIYQQYIGLDVRAEFYAFCGAIDSYRNYSVSGVITVRNPAPVAVSFTLSDYLTKTDSTTIPVALYNCPTTVAAHGTVTCPYVIHSENVTANVVFNTVTVVPTLNAHRIEGSSYSAPVSWREILSGVRDVNLRTTLNGVPQPDNDAVTNHDSRPNGLDYYFYVNHVCTTVGEVTGQVVISLVELGISYQYPVRIDCILDPRL